MRRNLQGLGWCGSDCPEGAQSTILLYGKERQNDGGMRQASLSDFGWDGAQRSASPA